ncbi:hypothetical protein MRX96_027062 [Rhipicephalus microplus]
MAGFVTTDAKFVVSVLRWSGWRRLRHLAAFGHFGRGGVVNYVGWTMPCSDSWSSGPQKTTTTKTMRAASGLYEEAARRRRHLRQVLATPGV